MQPIDLSTFAGLLAHGHGLDCYSRGFEIMIRWAARDRYEQILCGRDSPGAWRGQFTPTHPVSRPLAVRY